MVNPQLADYIRQELAAGISKDDITKTLAATGWQRADIQEAMAAVGTTQLAPSATKTAPATGSGVNPEAVSQVYIGSDEPVRHNSAGKLFLVFFIVVLLSAGGLYAAYYFNLLSSFGISIPTTEPVTPAPVLPHSGPATPPSQGTSTPLTSSMMPPLPVSTTTPAAATTTGPTQPVAVVPEACTTLDCLKTHVASCTPATYTAPDGLASATTYTVVGPVSAGCSVTFVYTQYPNPAWINQPFTCTYDPKADFAAAFENRYNTAIQGKSTCTGPLVALLKK